MNSEILYKRLLRFGQKCQQLVVKLPKNIYNFEYGGQLIRSSASPGSNYIEAIEAISPRDFIHRLKICRKETKESTHWLMLIQGSNKTLLIIQTESEELLKEARELIRIFSSSILTAERNQKIKK